MPVAERWSEQTAKSFADLENTAKLLAAEGTIDFNFTKAQLVAYLNTLYADISNVVKATVAKDLASIAATTEATETFAVTGAATTDTVSVSVAGGLDAGLVITNAWISAVDTVSITFYNLTGSAIDQASKDFYITLHK